MMSCCWCCRRHFYQVAPHLCYTIAFDNALQRCAAMLLQGLRGLQRQERRGGGIGGPAVATVVESKLWQLRRDAGSWR